MFREKLSFSLIQKNISFHDTASEYMHTQYNRVFTVKRARAVKNLLILKLLMKKISRPEIVTTLIKSLH